MWETEPREAARTAETEVREALPELGRGTDEMDGDHGADRESLARGSPCSGGRGRGSWPYPALRNRIILRLPAA
jgi:hypothetical protein